MPTIGSETYRDVEPIETNVKSTHLSSEPAEVVLGPDFDGLFPVIESLNPAELEVPGEDAPVEITGSGFTSGSVINWNGGDEATEYVDEVTLRTTVKPSTVEAPLPFSLPVYVRNGELKSNSVQFTFVEAQEPPPEDGRRKKRKHD